MRIDSRTYQPRAAARALTRRGERAFTMVEIAISLAVVAFALVAIIGVLPTGLQVQRDNREETLINADGTYILEALRTGNDRLGLLSNSVYLISINFKDGSAEVIPNENALLSGQQIVALLGTPKSPFANGVSNVVAWVRSLNNSAINLDPNARDLSFRYQLVLESNPFLGYPPALTNGLSTNEVARIAALQNNLRDVRMTMRWPLFRDSVNAPQNARVGTGRRTFRMLIGGAQITNRVEMAGSDLPGFYYLPSTY